MYVFLPPFQAKLREILNHCSGTRFRLTLLDPLSFFFDDMM